MREDSLPGKDAPDSGLRRQSRLFAGITTGIMLLLVLLILLTVRLAVLDADEDGTSAGVAAVGLGLYWLPALFYLWGLWAIRRIFRDLARGAMFEPAVGAGLTHLGWAIVGGAAASAVAVPNLLRWSIQAGLFPGSTRPHQGLLHFDVASLLLALVGGAILLLARLLRIAAAYQEESRKLRSELDEFF
jgi:hypothetical protein